MELDPEARRILDLAASARLPSARDKAQVERRLALVLGSSAVASLAAAEAGRSAWLTRAAGFKTAATAGVIVATALAGWHFSQSAAPAAATRSSEPTAPLIAAAPARPASAPFPPPTAAAQPSLPPSASGRLGTSPISRVQSAKPPRARAAAPDSLARELELLHRAQTAWRAQNPKLALELLDQHRASFPHSSLQLERDGLRVLSLCELGRRSQAEPLLRDLLHQAPDSPLRASLEQACNKD